MLEDDEVLDRCPRISASAVAIARLLGSGQTSDVYRGMFGAKPVAVKIHKTSANECDEQAENDYRALREEAGGRASE